MSHCNLLLHLIISVQGRRQWIDKGIREELYAYIGGTIKEHKSQLLAAGGVEDHLHLLVNHHPSFAIANTMRLIKSNSSTWMQSRCLAKKQFRWQKGYGAFSVSGSDRERVVCYINNQVEHHRKQSFEDEYLRILNLCGIDYDPRYVFDEAVVG